jgi:oligopeptide/dipeptide ABC transporter ATP-binding protein
MPIGDEFAVESTVGAPPPILEVRGLVQRFPLRSGRGSIAAVDDVSLAVPAGSTLGLVGESGSGKTSIAYAVLRITRPASGEIRFAGEDVATLAGDRLKRFRREVQMVFQDPYSSLDPRMSVGRVVGEPLHIHRLGTAREREKRIAELLTLVSLPPETAARYPEQLSGGQRQRVGIARALALEPRLLICDEPVSALDVSVQAQVLNLLKDLRRRLNLACLFISHDLAVVRFIADQIAVMYLGKIVEVGPKQAVLLGSRHPYTRALLSAAPTARTEHRRTPILLRGDIPSAASPPSGCRFHTRCPIAAPICSRESPRLQPVNLTDGYRDHRAACHFSSDVASRLASATVPESAR